MFSGKCLSDYEATESVFYHNHIISPYFISKFISKFLSGLKYFTERSFLLASSDFCDIFIIPSTVMIYV